MRDLDLPVLATDSRRLEVVVDGLPLFGEVDLVVDTTLVCAMHCDGTPHDGAANRDAGGPSEPGPSGGVGSKSRRALVSRNQVIFGPNLPRQSLVRKHLSFKNVASKLGTAKVVATSLLELKVAHGSDGDIPSCSEVVGDHRYDGRVVSGACSFSAD